jgi:hypothetical protein
MATALMRHCFRCACSGLSVLCHFSTSLSSFVAKIEVEKRRVRIKDTDRQPVSEEWRLNH